MDFPLNLFYRNFEFPPEFEKIMEKQYGIRIRSREEMRKLYLTYLDHPSLVEKYYGDDSNRFHDLVLFHGLYPDSQFKEIDVRGLPETIRDPRDEHLLDLRRSRSTPFHVRCEGCLESVRGYRYACNECSFSLHPCCVCDSIPATSVNGNVEMITVDAKLSQQFTLPNMKGIFRFTINDQHGAARCSICERRLGPRGNFASLDGIKVIHPHCFKLSSTK